MSEKKTPIFEKEIKLLDETYTDMLEIIHEKPNVNDVENMRLWIDNAFVKVNKAAFKIKDVRNLLIDKDIKGPIVDTYNSPA